MTFNQTDHVLVENVTGTGNIESLKRADCDTDHCLVCIKYKHKILNKYTYIMYIYIRRRKPKRRNLIQQ